MGKQMFNLKAVAVLSAVAVSTMCTSAFATTITSSQLSGGLTIKASNTTLSLQGATTVDGITVDPTAGGSTITASDNASVTGNVQLNAPVTIGGSNRHAFDSARVAINTSQVTANVPLNSVTINTNATISGSEAQTIAATATKAQGVSVNTQVTSGGGSTSSTPTTSDALTVDAISFTTGDVVSVDGITFLTTGDVTSVDATTLTSGDIVQVSNLTSGDVINVYDAQSGTKIGKATATGTTARIALAPPINAGRIIWITRTQNGRAESARLSYNVQ